MRDIESPGAKPRAGTEVGGVAVCPGAAGQLSHRQAVHPPSTTIEAPLT